MDRPIGTDDSIAARTALDAAEDGERRILAAVTYGQAAPYLVLWGLVWLGGYTGTYLAPRSSGSIWIAATVAGWLATGALVLIQTRGGRGAALVLRMRYAASAIVLTGYASLWAFLLGAPHPNAQGVYAGTVTGFAYLVAGLWRGRLLAGLGLAVTALFLIGLTLAPPVFQLYAGCVGGGGLIAAGLLLALRDPT
ncbi:hypothetical protein [Methylobacterium hispanicum]|uniref:hypothetical protein n=1 Tax=Methylobacterium hispanicum TaxID=270350 RepID=UPI002F2CBE6F